MDTILNWYKSLSEEWQIAIFTIAIPILVALFLAIAKKLFYSFRLKSNKSEYILLSEKLSNLSKQIREMLAEYTRALEDARWKPHLSSSNRETSIAKTNKIEAEINRKFKKYFEHDSTKLLKRANLILNRTDYKDRTKVLSGHLLLNEYCDHLNDIAEQLRVL